MAASLAYLESELENQSPDTDSLVTTILEGRQVDNNLNQKLNDLLTRGVARLKQAHHTDNNNPGSVFERIQRAKGAFDENEVHAFLAPYENYFAKSSELSIHFREKGNAFYKSKNVDGALRAYTLAVAFAPTTGINKGSAKDNLGEELMLAYTNRSAVLLQRNNASEALVDIQRALKILATGKYKVVPNLKEKLNERKVKCELAMRSVANSANEHDAQLEADIKDKLFKLEDPSKNIPNAESFVEVKYSPERGRHLTVTKDVTAGSVLLIDKPYVGVLNKLLRWETEYCHNCSKGVVNGIPCLDCTFALFCSEACRDTANKKGGIHHFEHKYLPFLHCLDSTQGDIQSLRILATVSKKEILAVCKNIEDTSTPKGVLPGFDKSGVYNVKSYLPIFQLISHPPSSTDDDNDNFGEALKNDMKALLLKGILKMYTNYFEGETTDYFEDLVASLILRHLESIKYNAISLSKLIMAAGKNGAAKSVASYAAAVYPLISLCNHSCDPNCAPVKQTKHLVTSLVALKHLNKGDELFITYKPLYTQMTASERQKFLAERYRFVCNCQACEEKWGPAMIKNDTSSYGKGALLILQPSRCENCSVTSGSDKKQDKVKQCHECALKDLGRANKIQEIEGCLFECHDVIMGEHCEETATNYGDTLKHLDCLKEILDYFGREGFRSYFPLYNVALDLFKRALVQSVAQL